MGFSNEIREKLNIKGPNYVPGYDFSQAIIEQTMHNKGGLQKTSEGFLNFIENMGINPQDPTVPLKKLAEEYLLRPYITKVQMAKHPPAETTVETEAVTNPNLIKVTPPKPQPTEGETGQMTESIPDLLTRRLREQAEAEGAGVAPPPEEEVIEAEALTELQPQPAAGEERVETPAQRASRTREFLAGLNEFLAQPGEEATQLRERLVLHPIEQPQ